MELGSRIVRVLAALRLIVWDMIMGNAKRDDFRDRIQRAVTSWPGVTVGSHRFGGIEFRVGRRELGHLHGGRLADLPFPIAIRRELVDTGKAERHHVLPHTGWVSRPIRDVADVEAVVELFRLNYDRPWLHTNASRSDSASHP